MLSLSDIIVDIPPSPTLAATDKANKLKAEGKDVIALTVGEPDFNTPDHIKAAAVEALNKNMTRYVSAQGILPLREEIVKKIKNDQKLEYKPSEVIVTNGGKHALAAAFSVLLNPGDEVVIPAPYWTSYPDMVKIAGGVPVILETKAANGYEFTADDLLKVCTPKTKIIVLNTPSNPTGACLSESLLKEIAAAIKTLKNYQNIAIVSDEVYEYIAYDGFKHTSFLTVAPELREQSIIVNAFSKTYAMTGWRVGYAVGPKNVIDAMSNHQSQFTSNVCSIAQYAASKAYSDGGAFPLMMRDDFSRRLNIVCEAVKEMPGIALSVKPRGAFYTFLEVDGLIGKKTPSNNTITCGNDFTEYLLNDFNIVTVQGEAFGAKAAFRISFALETSQLLKALDRIKEAASKLK
ncbi:MAG: pyridoxal phosphate-dependent aminotransferase [Proteobacteria bacterium]|nr:pyridoxal phosphate-dependent aminotransferase [Pseudomonadota bacterium]